MIPDKVTTDINEHIENLAELRKWLDKVYYHPEFGNLFNKPVISMLDQAASYLKDNLTVLRDRHIAKKELG